MDLEELVVVHYNVCQTCGAKDGMAGILINGDCLTCKEKKEKKENQVDIEQTIVTIKTNDTDFLLELIEFLNKTSVPQGSTIVRFDSPKEKVIRDATR